MNHGGPKQKALENTEKEERERKRRNFQMGQQKNYVT